MDSVGNEKFIAVHLLNGPISMETLSDHIRSRHRVLARWHIDIDCLHGEPDHKYEKSNHRKDTAYGCVIRRVVLVGQTNRLSEPIEFL